MADREIPPEVNLQERFQEEAQDPAMQAYLRSLGIDPNYVPPADDDRRVVISEFQIIFRDHDVPVVINVESPEELEAAKNNPMVVKEGSHFKMRLSFRVQHNVVLGLKLTNTIYGALGAKLASDEEMLGTYPPKEEFQFVEIPRVGWNEAPKGAIARGQYKAKCKFLDDDGNCHLTFEYLMKISKRWAEE